ncbi:MAG: cadherin-like beta sandwich domain-containing protein, partial [Chloroflexi bacterium]|nr:cadherin-like beta sandwich domain-containing protein [Chloroflexota bacterium]
RILPSDNWTPKPRTHSLKISVQGTSGHPRVVEDSFEIISSPVIGDVYGNRELIQASVTFTDPVTVNDDAGTPTLKFLLGDPDNPARTERMRYASGSGTDTLVFEYRVLPDDQDANGIYIHAHSLQLNGGTINRAGYDLAALLKHPIPTGYGRARIDSSIERPLALLTDLVLRDLDLADIALQPDFSPDLINYAATVHGGVAATTVTATRDDDTDVTITPADSNDFQPGHQVALGEGDNVIEILVTRPGHIDVPYTVEIRREPMVIPRITGVRVISRPLNQNTNVYRNDEPVEFEFTFDPPALVDLTGGRPTLAVDIWLNDSPQGPTDFPYARGSGTNALVFQLLNDEAGLLETAVGFGLSANSINVPEHSSITHSPGGGNANLNHRALHRISNQYLDGRRNAPLAALDQVHLTNVTLDQRFRSRKTLYTATPDHGATVTTVTVTPKNGVSYTIMPEDADDVADGHQVTLHHGTNEIVLTATKEGAATMTYTIAVVVLTTPRVESIAIVSEAPDNQTYVVGDVIKIAVTFDQPILVDTTNGTPIIRVRFGSDEQPVDYSETTDDSRTIIFSHTVDHSRRDGDGISIPENPMNANGGIIRYLHSNTHAFLDHQGIPDQTQHRVDPDPAIIDDGVQITSNPIEGDTYDSGETITFTVQFNTQITVKTDEGTPYLQFTMGDDAKQAGYTAISGDKRTLTFSYTVAAGDRDDDGISMAANALSRNGGTIKDENSINDAFLEHPAPGTNGVFIGHNVDGNRPTIADGGVAVISTPLALPDAYGRNEIIVVSVTFTSPVVVDTTDGTPTLSIKVATPTYFPLHRKAQYQRGSGSSTLQFEWRVRRIDWDTNGIGILADALQLNGGTIRDAVTGTDVLLTNPWIDPVINFPDHKVRGGLLADFTSLSDLSLSGGTLRPAFDSTVLRYTAAFPTDTTSTTVTATAPSGNTVAIQPDDADSETTGHQVDLTQEPEEIIVTVTTASAATYIYRVKTFLSDTEITALAISSDPGSDSTYATGDVITATVTYNVPVTVDTTDGTPALMLKVGDTARAASYTGSDESGKLLTFSYTVVSEDSDQDGVSIAANSLTLNGGSITAGDDSADALLIHLALPTQAGHLVNKIPLIVTDGVQITSNPASGDTYQAGETITFTVTFDSNVAVDTTDGTPSLTIAVGSANRQAAYTGIDATNRILTFAYTVADDDLDEDGLSVPVNAIALNSGTITHTTTSKDADLDHPLPGTDGLFPGHKVNAVAVAPAIADGGVTITSMPLATADTYGRSEIIVISVAFTSPVVVNTADGTPTMTFKVGNAGRLAVNRKAEYQRGSGSSTLQFEWRVPQGSRDNNGIRIRGNALQLNGGTIRDATTGIDALLSHPDPVSEITFGNHKLDGRLLADFTNLSDLSLSGGTLAPNFGTTVLRYTATFPADATSTTVTATAPADHTVTIQPADSDTEAT